MLGNLLLHKPLTVLLYLTPHLSAPLSALCCKPRVHTSKVEAENEAMLILRSEIVLPCVERDTELEK